MNVATDQRLASIAWAATTFRHALETMARADVPSLVTFPRGACGDASPLLGQYLTDLGFGDWNYVSGRRPLGHGVETHGWIEQEGLIVDITADQFPEITDAVVVTLDRTWHDSFGTPNMNSPARTDVYDDDTTLALTMLYQRALDQLEGNEEQLGSQSHLAGEVPGVES